ncbi:uncharacterized protein FOBCDRAFT_203540 [Fusarium oxysporum Fo47]|uniref:uncharacterized protein n=1 Tax=Fusarium oxysporum Fo47 TaxID=660027 RepID=UPI002869C44A|nr:uncharacterized protein FOBCDRAFT_203540 [Fusarium oxysporum Fo47]WJG35583.1 hypothetical protein FOBCDRAFT_203540 [Fusarium oxysporum Fo47]
MRPKSESFYTDITFLGGNTPVNVSVFPMPNSHVGAPHRIIDLDEDPLSKRCLAFQERYFSPRTLHFAQAQMYFGCESCFEAQEGHTEPVRWDPPKYGLPTSLFNGLCQQLSELVAVPLNWVEKSNDLIYNVRGPYYLILTMADTNSRTSGDIPRFRRVGAGSLEITGGSDVQLSLVRAMFRRGREQGKLDEIIIE